MKLLMTLLMLISLNSHADEWTTTEVTKEVISVSLLSLDWMQTRDISNHPGMYETNIIMGKEPRPRNINVYFSTVIIGHVFIADSLSSKYLNYLQNGTIALELVVIGHNKSFGLNYRF